MVRNLSVEIWGTTDGDPNKLDVKASGGSDDRVDLVLSGKSISVRAEDLIELARMLDGMRPKKG